MRIVWSEEAALQIAAILNRMRERVQDNLQRSQVARAALRDANPDGDNKRLNAIEANFEKCIEQLRQAGEEIDALLTGVRTMIDLFEGAERSVITQIEALPTGRAAEQLSVSRGVSPLNREIEVYSPPIPLPQPRRIPHSYFGAMGPVPGWLNQKAQAHQRTIKGGLPWQNS